MTARILDVTPQWTLSIRSRGWESVYKKLLTFKPVIKGGPLAEATIVLDGVLNKGMEKRLDDLLSARCHRAWQLRRAVSASTFTFSAALISFAWTRDNTTLLTLMLRGEITEGKRRGKNR